MKFILAIALALAATVNGYDVASLTPENYDTLTDGKTVFIKFFAPWVSGSGLPFSTTHSKETFELD